MVYQVLENDLEEYYKIIMNKEYSDKLIIAYFTANGVDLARKWYHPLFKELVKKKIQLLF